MADSGFENTGAGLAVAAVHSFNHEHHAKMAVSSRMLNDQVILIGGKLSWDVLQTFLNYLSGLHTEKRLHRNL